LRIVNALEAHPQADGSRPRKGLDAPPSDAVELLQRPYQYRYVPAETADEIKREGLWEKSLILPDQV
jgi:hypothetical protein